MTSVNKIKELAEAKEYSLAVEILDSQDLEKSLNPQFLRVCGEVYENVGRLADARNMYVKAHIMGPESNRILFSIITFYLKQGYFDLAEQYQEQYISNAKGNEQEQSKLSYVMKKAQRAGLDELRSLLEPYYTHSMDEEWSFELFLLMTMQGEDTEMLAADYKATFRRSNRLDDIQDVISGKKKPEDLFWIYAKDRRPDKNPEEEAIRELEKEQLKKDYLRLHPFVPTEETEETVQDTEVDYESAEILEEQGTEKKLKSFLKRKFRKKNPDGSGEETEADGEAGTEEGTDTPSKEGAEKMDSPEDKEENNSEEVSSDSRNTERESDTEQSGASQGEGPDKVGSVSDSETETGDDEAALKSDRDDSGPETKTGITGSGKDSESGQEKDEEEEAREKLERLISVDFDDGFAAETDDISDLDEETEEIEQSPLSILNLCAAVRQEEPMNEESLTADTPVEATAIREAPIEESEAEDIDTAEEKDVPEAVIEEADVERAGIEETELTVGEGTVPERETGLVIDEEPDVFDDEEPISWEEEPVVKEEPEPVAEEEPEPVAEEEPEPVAEEEPEPIAEEEPEPVAEEEPEPIAEEEPEPVEKGESGPPAGDPKISKETADSLAENAKLDEGLLEEERLQKEAEALLASLGIKL